MFSKAVRREVLFLLAAKLAALTLIYFLFFAPHEVRRLAANDIAAHLIAGSENQGESHGHR
jgi:hypothetical protein